ncbi:hypothetical protein TWF788_000642 [Orbilia oligospora]|uniref:Azaphilone pigments biosynthesis cluster protein L N-terminal domain-containing protein n=1 Tax=Orbilia oligospora TaxID=2813651 RepID=A0A7C8K9G8_ORBOL|nr:hypothetical protein TWF788_000642 [Orbilia oligospora]
MSGLEGLSIGANVIGVLVFGLQAAKFIAESVSKYQDAEDDHRRFLDAIQRLAGVLTDVNEILKTDEDKLRYSRLYTVAKKCEDDLIKIHDNILEWTGSTSGKKSKTVRTWKKFKLIFLGDNSKRWLESLESHYGFILFQLNRIQLDDRKEQKAAVGRIESNLSHVSDTISNIEDTQVETLVRIDKVESSVTTHSTVVRDLRASVDVNFNQVNGALGSISSLVQLFANTEFHKSSQERERDELEKATGRIFRLSAAAVTRRKANIQKEQTEEVLDDIRKIIDFAKNGQFSDLSSAQVTENPQQKNRKLAGLLAGTEALSIGYDHQDFAALLSRSNQPKTSATSICQWDQDDFSLRVSENLQCDVPGGKRQLGSSEFSRRVTKITYLPKTNGVSSIIDIYLAQPQGPGASIYTGLSFRAILPNDAEILVAIYSGSLEGVRRLVSTKQANVNDCDLWGQSLLTVSLMKAQYISPDWYSELDVAQLAKNRLEITKYLISQGSDVTSIDSENYDPLSAAKSWDNNEGVALVLENGGNPVLRPDTILSFARHLDEVSWRRFLDQVCEFYDINDSLIWQPRKGARPVPLLHSILGMYAVHEIWQAPYLYDHNSTYSRMYYHLPNYDLKTVVRKLVSSGADPTGRCPEGENCLHLVLNSTLVPECIPTEDGPARLKDLLLFLVGEFGFDVRAKTNDGYSVSDYAFGARCPVGRCIGPIWIEVLMELGYDPLEVAEGSIYFAHIKQFMVSKPVDYCFCQTCQLADEHDYIHIFRHGEDIANSSTTSECYIEGHGENDITASNGINNYACGDFEFFEKLSLGSGFNEECKTSYDASVSQWARILEDWEYIEEN